MRTIQEFATSLEDKEAATQLVKKIATDIAMQVGANSLTALVRDTLAEAKPHLLRRQNEIQGEVSRLALKRGFFSVEKYQQFSQDASMPQRIVETNINTIEEHVASMALVACHSFFEECLHDILKLTRLCRMQAWLALLGEKSVPMREILEGNIEPTLQTMLNKLIYAIERDSIRRKISTLGKILGCDVTKSSEIGYSYSLEALEVIDNKRHDIAHRRKTDVTIETCNSDTEYLVKSCWHFLDVATTALEPEGPFLHRQ